jgi:nucleoid DNA-binding protein
MAVTKNDMVVEISRKTGIEQQKVKQIVQLTLDGVTDVLVDEGRIELRNFGIFEVRVRKARKARNPRTGAEVMVPSKRVVTFKAGKIMEERIAAIKPAPVQPAAPARVSPAPAAQAGS